jgi:tetratricopeptide (TPR) repeat protein
MLSAVPIFAEHLPSRLSVAVRAEPLLYGGLAALVIIVLLVLWLLWGSGPRRNRACHRARRLLGQGAWEEALALAQEMQKRRLSSNWHGRVRNLEGECYRAASQAALKDQDYEAGLDHALCAAELLNANVEQARHTVVEAMLAEARRLFSASSGHDTESVHKHLSRLLAIQPDCLEAKFWQGLCHVREGNTELALEAMRQARGGEANASTETFLDPLLYLGALLLRGDQPKEALRHLTEANRLDKNCPLVTWQLSTAMLAAGGDAQVAVRALQRALGPQGVLLWASHPQRLWVEAFPEKRSYVRRLASQRPYTCPLWGSDLHVILSQGQTTLAEGLYRLGKLQEAADLFDQVARHSAPSRLVLRGLGLALSRLGRFDEAFTHLRTAHDLEEPKDRWTTGYLALCGARARPLRPEDKEKNVAWAIRLMTRFTAPGDAEWVDLVSKLFAEARAVGLTLGPEDQLYLCEHLLSVQATDAAAAEAYHHLAATFPEAFRPEYAWLYCRAAQQHRHNGPRTLELFARTFREQEAARVFFRERQWDFDEMEFAYLQSAAQRQPGAFPEALGANYPAHGEKMLEARSLHMEQGNRMEDARVAAQVWLMLSPRSSSAHDRLAYLSYLAGDAGHAVDLLAGWERLEPANPWPLVRQAVIRYQRGDAERGSAALSKALTLTEDRSRAAITFLGARLALKSGAPGDNEKALELLEECLRHDPRHSEARWCLAAVRLRFGDLAALAAQAPFMKQPESTAVTNAATVLAGSTAVAGSHTVVAGSPDPATAGRFQLLAAVCHLAAGDYSAVMDACQRAVDDPALAIECAYVMGWAALLRKDPGTAALTLRRVADSKESPSTAHARALLGAIRFYQGDNEEAIQWWAALDPDHRAAWQLIEPLQQVVLLSALKAMEAGQFELAAEKIREAGKLGLGDRRLGPLLTLVLVQAGQKLLYQ